MLIRHVDAGRSVLVGFDFPYGFPAGTAAALGLPDPAWLAIWSEFRRLVRDDQDQGANNRFELADELNRRLGQTGPFWGHPHGRVFSHLAPTRPAYPCGGLDERRRTDRAIRGAKPVWQLFGIGSVGSQALLGIRWLSELVDDGRLRPVTKVWPFETGCTLPMRPTGPRVVHAEIYPSMVPIAEEPGQVRDALQVKALAHHLARSDANGSLAALFAAPASHEAAALEEGWILGATAPSRV